MKHRGEYFGGGNFNDDPWQLNPKPTMKYHVWKGYEPFDFEETRATLRLVCFTKVEAEEYVSTHEIEDGTYWIDEIVVHYR